MKTNLSSEVLLFWDVLIPGTEGWPSASEALRDITGLPALLDDADIAWLSTQAAVLQAMPLVLRSFAMRQLENQEPERFCRVLKALYEAYYTSPLAHAAVLRLAEASPREASASFDGTLLRQVIATGAGQRRM